MKKIPLGLGMYTVYKDVLTDMAAAFTRLGGMGYDAIEFYGEPEYDIGMVKKALAVSELALASWHIEWRNVQKETIAGTIRYLKDVGCSRAIVPCLGGKWNVAHTAAEERRGLWEEYARGMNGIAARLSADGIQLGYHNHEHEFLLAYDGERVFDIFFDRLDPEIIMELDTGNAIEGGGDPVAVLARYRSQPLILHLKPFSARAGFNTVLGAPDDLNDWKAILAAGAPHCLALLVESESMALPGMDNARACIEGLRRFL